MGSLNWGAQPTALQRICSLSFRFFSEEENKHVLFPTLIAVCYENQRNTSVVEQELSVDMIVDYIQKNIDIEKNSNKDSKLSAQGEEDGTNDKENDPAPGEGGHEIDSSKRDDKEGDMWSLIVVKRENADPLKWSFEQRFPRCLWDNALNFFNSMQH